MIESEASYCGKILHSRKDVLLASQIAFGPFRFSLCYAAARRPEVRLIFSEPIFRRRDPQALPRLEDYRRSRKILGSGTSQLLKQPGSGEVRDIRRGKILPEPLEVSLEADKVRLGQQVLLTLVILRKLVFDDRFGKKFCAAGSR